MMQGKPDFKLSVVLRFSFFLVVITGGAAAPLFSQGNREDEHGKGQVPTEESRGGRDMQITSSAFNEGDMIPARYSCDGEDLSPALAWSGSPGNTESFALICDDPDAPVGTWVHWVLFNIPGSAEGLQEGISADKTLQDGSVHGKNSWGRLGYGGPCPPGGTHRYFFKLYSLDKKLDLQPGASKGDVENAMKGHILGEAQIMGRYSRK
jgi:Raf kinase inhibitor-like YbhB/YbcL family protein